MELAVELENREDRVPGEGGTGLRGKNHSVPVIYISLIQNRKYKSDRISDMLLKFSKQSLILFKLMK